jgi:DNA topoisomerase-1
MQLAQRLYEAGLITYMRTDSVNLSKDAMEAAQAEIIKSYGKISNLELLSIKVGAQKRGDRPTDMSRHTNIDRPVCMI